MKSDEALEQIAYLKKLAEKSRLIAAYGYKFYILWGILLIIGFFTSVYLTPWLIWLIIDATGFLLTLIFILQERGKEKTSALLKKIGIQSIILLITGFIIFYVISGSSDLNIRAAFWPFHVGTIYLIASVHIGKDLFTIGLWLAAAAIASVFMPAPLQNFWLGISCGGGMIVTGIIFRNQIRKIRG
ncbi:MAG: hypothetical protein JW864_15880 [Spirochaetes bacterium]|nr:hypothetical protein [Spirochaetota bacterium]